MRIKPSEYLQRCLKINLNSQVSALLDCLTSVVTFEVGDIPIFMDEDVQSFYFIIYGLVRGYYLDNAGKEVTKCFASENCFFGSECYRTNKTPTFFVECLEECKCIQIPYSLVRRIEDIDEQTGNYVRSLYLDEVGKLEVRAKDLLLLNAEERYLFFCRQYPNLQKRLQLKYIASYIGIQAGAMSRIRRNLKD